MKVKTGSNELVTSLMLNYTCLYVGLWIITTFFYPAGVPFQFSEFYTYIKERGYVLYPGKLTDADTFRVGNIGEIYPRGYCQTQRQFWLTFSRRWRHEASAGDF